MGGGRGCVVSLPPITWAGLDLNPGHLEDDFTAVVTGVDGWLDSPPLEGRDAERVLTDGDAFGPKTLGARQVTISGAAAGPAGLLAALRDDLAARAAQREPAELAIGDPATGQVLTATVRAGTERLRHEFIAGAAAFRWEVTLSAADPRLYDATWQQAVLTNLGDAATGRHYPRTYPWAYAAPELPNTATLANPGNVPAPVWAAYAGHLTSSRLTDADASILVATLEAGTALVLSTEDLTAEAPGGASRAAYILPGSRPLLIPPRSTATWHLYGTGTGSVTLGWRGAWI